MHSPASPLWQVPRVLPGVSGARPNPTLTTRKPPDGPLLLPSARLMPNCSLLHCSLPHCCLHQCDIVQS